MSWFSEARDNVIDEVKRSPKNVEKIVREFGPAAAGALLGGPLGLIGALGGGMLGKGRKGADRGPKPLAPNFNVEMPELCRVNKGGVIVDESEVIYDYKTIAASALTNTDFFDDTTTTNITEAKKIPEGVYKEVALTLHLNATGDHIGMIQDAIVRVKSGKNGDIVWERAVADLSDFFLVDTFHGVTIRQDGDHAEDADIVVVDGNDLTYFNILWPSGLTTTGNMNATLRLRRYPLPAAALAAKKMLRK